jgi:hypothetical protein
MITGLFPRPEREVVVGILEKSVVFLTPDSVTEILEKVRFLSAAWDLANLYLTSIGAPCLSEEAIQLEGLSPNSEVGVLKPPFSCKIIKFHG